MNISEVTDGIREYTGNGSGVHMDTLLIAQNVIFDVVGFLLGMLVFFMAVGMVLVTSLDIMYITIPVMQDRVKDLRWDGSRKGKPRIISKDAGFAVEQSTISGTPALGIYLKKRIKTYCIAAVVMYICIGGSNMIVPLISKVVLQILKGFS